MDSEQVDHIRADIQQAIFEAAQHDPTVTLEVLWRLFDSIAAVAAVPDRIPYPAMRWPRVWATHVLRDVQLRATSKIPYGEPIHDEPPEDHRD